MIGLLFAIKAYACMNLVDALDAELMVQGINPGKALYACTTKDCVCLDGVDSEVSKISGKPGKKILVVDEEKKKSKEEAIAAKQKAELQERQDKIDRESALAELKALANTRALTEDERAEALRLLLNR